MGVFRLNAAAVSVALAAAFLLAHKAPAAAQTDGDKGDIYFSFISSAYYMDKKWGQGMPWDGIKKLAEVAHANGIPVTWLVSPRSAEEGKELWKEYHDKYGDAFGHFATTGLAEANFLGSEANVFAVLTQKKMYKRLAEESESIKKSLPWADIRIGAAGHRSTKMALAFERLGYWGMWGHCWEQTHTDNISDRGSPWGFFYVSRDKFKAPGREPGGVAALEWTARDLNLAFRTGNPEVWSTDPNDVGRAGICDANQCDYWIRLADEYARNAKYNKVVPFMVHQEAHEMENSERIRAYSPEDIEAAASMLDRLFKHMKEIGAKIVTANEALEAYRNANAMTPPTYALFRDVHKPVESLDAHGDYHSEKSLALVKDEGFEVQPEVLVYYDINGQLFFERGKTSPIRVYNYLDDSPVDASTYAQEPEPPEAKCEETAPGRFECVVESTKTLPYGLAFWGEHQSIKTEGADEPIEKILEGELAFTAFVLKPGENRVVVRLDGS